MPAAASCFDSISVEPCDFLLLVSILRCGWHGAVRVAVCLAASMTAR